MGGGKPCYYTLSTGLLWGQKALSESLALFLRLCGRMISADIFYSSTISIAEV